MNPDDIAIFRHARLLLLLAEAGRATPDGIDAERLGIYDFLAMHPLLLARREDDPDRLTLRLAGFDDRAIAYASPSQRFVSARLHLTRDLTDLVGRKLVRVTAAGRIRYRLTPDGASMASQFTAMYSQSYVTAARIVIRRTRRLSGRKLREGLREWLTMSPDRPDQRLHPAYLLDDDDVPDAPASSDPAGRPAPRRTRHEQ
ncbi:hypothetical protein ACI2K4_09695 [Micromonospora sp. NPDC050397]|uniref:hypothetical protein n=1 Tax=Micromonospora sp. NPDC050397 TaxID=3364279 RepID=UPI0038503C0C